MKCECGRDIKGKGVWTINDVRVCYRCANMNMSRYKDEDDEVF